MVCPAHFIFIFYLLLLPVMAEQITHPNHRLVQPCKYGTALDFNKVLVCIIDGDNTICL